MCGFLWSVLLQPIQHVAKPDCIFRAGVFPNCCFGHLGVWITSEGARAAKDAGLVVVYGYSDDNVEFSGAIDEEVGAYEDTTIYITKDGWSCSGGTPPGKQRSYRSCPPA